ncbi:hypothetical protein HMPREF1573_00856 [Gardnerella vaginalis JCP7276]|jgi:hypothetical protein|nr:hypothetical protein HMPREF1575_00730 [Gardnerella vaginalis JCP7672]EPI56483.1 hypothetical protein HMPREF1573_00856 [Gardnerella vaginalis JCP7276]
MKTILALIFGLWVMRNRLLLAYVTFIGACYLTLQYGILENGGAASRQSIRRRRSPHVIFTHDFGRGWCPLSCS